MRSASAASTNGQRATSRNPRVRMSSSAPGDEVRAESLSLELLGHLGVQQNDRAGLQAVHDLACDRVVEDELVAIQLWIVSDGDSRLGHAPSLAFSSSATLCWRGGPDAEAAERARFLSRLSPLVLRAPRRTRSRVPSLSQRIGDPWTRYRSLQRSCTYPKKNVLCSATLRSSSSVALAAVMESR
jgi:hypothetical protein